MQLIDTHGRVATDLRVSVTDRCNLRCQYCMPAEGLDWMPTEDTLTDDELNRLIRIGVEMLGIRDVRFTGGEPLLRRGLPALVGATKALPSQPRVAMTSNGLGLKRMAKALAEAGLDRVNISLDTTNRAGWADGSIGTAQLTWLESVLQSYSTHWYDTDGNVVRVRLKGACGGCPMSQLTLKMGIERILKKEVPEVKEVVAL